MIGNGWWFDGYSGTLTNLERALYPLSKPILKLVLVNKQHISFDRNLTL